MQILDQPYFFHLCSFHIIGSQDNCIFYIIRCVIIFNLHPARVIKWPRLFVLSLYSLQLPVVCEWSRNCSCKAFLWNQLFYYFLTIPFLSIEDWLTLKLQWLLWTNVWFSFGYGKATRMPVKAIVFPRLQVWSVTSGSCFVVEIHSNNGQFWYQSISFCYSLLLNKKFKALKMLHTKRHFPREINMAIDSLELQSLPFKWMSSYAGQCVLML